ncbi:ABC transporter permease, partial [Actinocorallia lasiicapitis]
ARPVSLGLGLPFARPGRTVLTVSAVALGVAACTFATGLERTLNSYFVDEGRIGTYQVEVFAGPHGPADPAELRRRPGTAEVATGFNEPASLPGRTGPVQLKAYTEGTAPYGYRMTGGRWFAGPGEVVVNSGLLRETGRRVGDSLAVRFGDRTTLLTITGTAILDGNEVLLTDPAAVRALHPDADPMFAEIALTPGTSATSYAEALRRDGMYAEPTDERGNNTELIVVLTLIGLLTLGVAVVAGLGVFNTVVLNTRDRARDFGVLKSLGATPRQVLAMVLTSMGVLGLLGGLLGVPLGLVAHEYVMPAMADPAGIILPYGFGEIYPVPLLALFVGAGLGVALLGALVPAGWAAKIKTAAALRSE